MTLTEKYKGTREGREILWSIIEESGVLNASPEKDPILLSFDNGKRNIGAKIISELLTDNTNAFSMMLGERFERFQMIKQGRRK